MSLSALLIVHIAGIDSFLAIIRLSQSLGVPLVLPPIHVDLSQARQSPENGPSQDQRHLVLLEYRMDDLLELYCRQLIHFGQ